jgi:hypothetical protein
VYFDLKLLPLPLPEHLPGFSSAREDAAGVEGQDPDEEIVGRVVTYVTWYGDTDTGIRIRGYGETAFSENRLTGIRQVYA